MTAAAPPTAEPRRRAPHRKAFIALASSWRSCSRRGRLGYVLVTRGKESTDDAQVAGGRRPVAARVGGHGRARDIEENQLVKRGDLVRARRRGLRGAREAGRGASSRRPRRRQQQADAQEQIVEASAQGGFASARAKVTGSSARVAARRRRRGSRAGAARAPRRGEEGRRSTQPREGAPAEPTRSRSRQVDNAAGRGRLGAGGRAAGAGRPRRGRRATARGAHAVSPRRKESSARARPSTRRSRRRAAQADARARAGHSAKAALDLARLQLSYTRIVAPADGRVVEAHRALGQLVAIGSRSCELVPTHDLRHRELQGDAGRQTCAPGSARRSRSTPTRVASSRGGWRASRRGRARASRSCRRTTRRATSSRSCSACPVRIAFVDPPKDLELRAGLSVDVTVYVR